MAVPTNTVTAHAAIGNRYDLADMIYDISPMDTPFLSGIQRNRADAVFHEWQTDALDAAANNKHVEGDDTSANALSPTVRIGNYSQISKKSVQVSGTQRAVNSAGRADEYSYQLAKRGKEIKRDMEFDLTQNQASSAGNASTARQSAGLEGWLSTNADHGATGSTTGFSGGIVGAPTDGTQRALTKSILDSVIQDCWTQGGDPKVIMVGAHVRTVISGFSGISTLQTDANAKQDVTLMGAVDFYKSNFGTHKVVPNRFQRARTGFVLDMDYFALSTLRNMEVEELAKTGDSDKSQLVCEWTLESKNEAASGKAADLSTS